MTKMEINHMVCKYKNMKNQNNPRICVFIYDNMRIIKCCYIIMHK